MSEAPCTSAGGQTPKKRAKSRARQDPPNPTSIYLSLCASPETYRLPPAKSVAVTTLQQQAFHWPEFWRTTGNRLSSLVRPSFVNPLKDLPCLCDGIRDGALPRRAWSDTSFVEFPCCQDCCGKKIAYFRCSSIGSSTRNGEAQGTVEFLYGKRGA